MWCYFLINVLAIFMVEEFYIYAVVQFFSARESVMYESKNQSHLSKVRIRQSSTPCNRIFCFVV